MAIAARISTITVTTPIPLRMPPPFDTPTVPRGCEAFVKTGGRCEGGPGYTVAAQTSQAAYAASTNTPSTRPARPRATNTVATTAYRAATPRNATDPAASTPGAGRVPPPGGPPPATRSAAPPATATRPPTVRRMAGPADRPARAGSSSRFDRPSRRTSPTYAP